MKTLITFLMILLSITSFAEGLMVMVGSGYAIVTFPPPNFDGGSPILGYTVTSHPAGGIDEDIMTTKLSHKVSGLTNGVTYTFTVTATNAVGTSPSSTPSNPVTPMAAPPICGTTDILLTSNSPIGNQWWFATTQSSSGSKIIGATSQTYKPTRSGYYWCVITISGCTTVKTRKIQRY
jgi:hypothetical protein